MPRRKKVIEEALAESRQESLLDEAEESEESSSPQSHSKNPILDMLIHKIGTFQLLKKERLLELFLSVDDLYADAIQKLSTHTNFLETIISDNLAEVLGGITSGRVVHNLPSDGEDDDVWAEHAPFIAQGLETLGRRLFGDKHQDFTAEVCGLKLVGSTIFSMLEAYTQLGNDYLYYSDQLALYMINSVNVPRKERAARIEALRDSMDELVELMCTKEEYIPYLTRNLTDTVERVRKIHAEIFNHHLRLLVKVATSHTKDSDQLLDNIQAGSLGLIRAIKDYVPPYNFIGYASSWIRQAVLGAMRAYSNNIRIPGNVLQEYSALEKVRHSMSNDATVEDLAKATNQDVRRVQRVYDLVQLAHTWSLDREVNSPEAANSSKDSGTISLGETIADDSPPLDEREDVTSRVKEYLGLLNEREHWVVCLYFGLLDYLQTNANLSEYTKSCKEVRVKIESRALESLRQRLVAAHLRLQRRKAIINQSH